MHKQTQGNLPRRNNAQHIFAHVERGQAHIASSGTHRAFTARCHQDAA